MSAQHADRAGQPILVRSYRDGDYLALIDLYTTGQLADDIDHHEIEFDLDFIDETYFSRPEDHLWLAEADGSPVGMIGVLGMGEAIAQIRWLRVDAAWRNTDLACRLLAVAIDHCRQYGYLKIVIMTSVRARRAIPLLRCLGFRYSRRITLDDHQMLEFYLDLYSHRDGADCLSTPIDGDDPASGFE